MVRQCIKMWNRVFSAQCDNFRHCEIFLGKINVIFWPARPVGQLFHRRFFISPLVNYSAGGYFTNNLINRTMQKDCGNVQKS